MRVKLRILRRLKGGVRGRERMRVRVGERVRGEFEEESRRGRV